MTKKFQKLSIISFSKNPDMERYFKLKKEVFPHPIYLGPARHRTSLFDISCFSRKNGLSILLFLDIVWATLQSIRLRFKGVTHVIFDNVHISSIFYGILFKALKIKQIHTIHDQTIHPGSSSLVTAIYYKYYCKYFSDEYIFFSNASFEFDPDKKNHVLKLCGFEKYESSRSTGKNALFFGRIQPYKGIEYLAAISDYLLVHHKDSKLVVMGRGYSPHLESLQQRSNVVVSNKFFSKEDLVQVAQQCAVTVLPYTSATQSGVMIESYSLGLPVVFFNAGSLRDYCPDDRFGLSAEIGDIDTLCQNLSTFLSVAPNAKGLLLNAFDTEFGVSAFEQQFIDLANRVLATP